MSDVVADTHAILWYLYEPSRLSAAALTALDLAMSGTLYVSAITLIEIVYLAERRRINREALDGLIDLANDPTTPIVIVRVNTDVARSARAIPRILVPDMPDRIIAATALYLGVPVVSADSKIRSSGIATIW